MGKTIKLKEQELHNIIKECVNNILSEDLVPTDKNGEVNLSLRQSVNAWKMIYNLMDNVKSKMDYDYQGKNGRISVKDVDNVIDYINMSLDNVIKNTIGNK